MKKLMLVGLAAPIAAAALVLSPLGGGYFLAGDNYLARAAEPGAEPTAAASDELAPPADVRARASSVETTWWERERAHATSGGGGGDGEDPDPAPVHNDDSDYHRPDSAIHQPGTNYHHANSDTHDVDSSVHYQNTDTHYYTSDYHWQNSDWHFPTSDFHVSNTDMHYADSDVHLNDSTLHTNDSDIHFPPSDMHERSSGGHYASSTQHQGSSTSHSANSDHHQIGSALHTATSGEGSNPASCPNPSPNWGDATVATPLLHVPLNCPTRLDVGHRIVTVNTPRARDLQGKLRLIVVGGDPSCVQIRKDSPSGPVVSLGSPVQVVEPGHVGCGVHTWHEGTQTFYVLAVKKGTVTLMAEVDPDPEVEGDGRPSQRSQVTIEAGKSSRGVMISYTGIIPCGAVLNANPFLPQFGCYGGDLPVAGPITTYRFLQSNFITLDPDALPLANNRLLQTHSFGESKGYAPVSCTPGALWYCMGISPLAPVPIASQTLQATPLNTVMVVDQLANGDFRSVHLLDATIPLDPMAPAINGSLSVFLKECNGEIYYSILGTHDGFPAHMIFIGFQLVYTYDPLAAGSSPLALGPPEDVFVNIPWTQL